ncbi:glycosyltransferase family 2 protein [Bifidobacterium pullorum subsp. saeculare]|uniref:Glycosyltransferase family 2 protein n=1 Tax=Bifidobacterium pullorum subsp. saeculare TaxID=78257 RepID=A0A938WWU1_9BIFI|nr:glycosyltransferase family 2 protein [Bifidobacterium pullorum]MBM6699043.1 glycosyltransferase family 2 protein [Bifidobacterium pullorum subsp. saeculare]
MDREQADDVRGVLAAALAGRAYSHSQDVDSSVAAVITVEDDLRFLPETLRAVFAQSVLPGTVVVADCTGGTTQPLATSFEVIHTESGPMSRMPEPKRVDVRLVRAHGARSFGGAVRKALDYAHLSPSVRALWLLHDDSRPADEHCLEHLTEAWHNAPTVALVGAKQLDWSGRNLHDVGSYAAGHRIETLVVDGEPDQEQYDGRCDVYAVSLAGMLLPLETYHAMGGIDDFCGTFVQSCDFCRRVSNGGGRVIVEPQARIAHRRARFEAQRTRAGEAVEEGEPANPSMALFAAWQRYYYTDVRMALWPLVWLWRLVRSLAMAVRLLLGKRPWQAVCELCMPWVALAGLPRAMGARRRVARCGRLPRTQLALLSASRAQIAQWRERSQAFQDQRGVVLLSPLAKAHLRRRLMVRAAAAAVTALACLVGVVALHWPVLRAAGSGSLVSASLPPTGASMRQLVDAATIPWVAGIGTGVPAPPAPWLMVLMAASVLTGGHVAAALTLMFVVSAPLAALSAWALAGIFTRSDIVRCAAGLAWVALAVGMGLYRTADLPMLTVMMFLPAAFAFVFRAVGMRRTEEPVDPRPSVQAAAVAALCFMPPVAAEPQLLLPLVVCFLVFVAFVRRRRATLLLIPVPAAFLVAPTLVNAVRYAPEGSWRQLFGDMTVPQTVSDGAPAALSLPDALLRALGVGHGATALASSPWALASVVAAAGMAVVALAALALPGVLRASRMMWVVAVCGGLLALASCRVAVAPGGDGAVAGSVLPGLALMAMGLLCCVCLVAGGAVSHFAMLGGPQRRRIRLVGKAAAASAARWVLVVAMLCAAGAWVGQGLVRSDVGAVSISSDGLPMTATEAMGRDEGQRVFALRADSSNSVGFSVMRTSRGDLIDSSPVYRARQVSGVADDQGSARLSEVAASLMANSDDQAIATLAELGFSGIYVTAGENAGDRLTANIAASNGTQSVVANAQGTYYRITFSGERAGADGRAGLDDARRSPWRVAWLWCAGLIVAAYCLVAVPHTSRIEQEG